MNKFREKEAYEYQEKINKLIKKIDNRVLTRPNTNMKHIWACLLVLIISYFIIGLIVLLINVETLYKILIFILAFLIFNEFYLRFFGIVLIKCYQHYGTHEMRITCKCLPSCSEYSILALKKYILIVAIIKIYVRLNKTCNGDYKEDYP